MAHPSPRPVVHVAPSLTDTALAVIVLDTRIPAARGGHLKVSVETLRQLPALLSDAIAKFDRQHGPERSRAA